jgi:hypothetical protein
VRIAEIVFSGGRVQFEQDILIPPLRVGETHTVRIAFERGEHGISYSLDIVLNSDYGAADELSRDDNAWSGRFNV